MKQHPIDRITQFWGKITGRKIDPKIDKWLLGPFGSPDLIGDKFIQDLAAHQQLEIMKNLPGSGYVGIPSNMTVVAPEINGP